ncbi:MAG: hypothetical protein ACTSVY_08030 [Candidatus Helarchaeota archaeon]
MSGKEEKNTIEKDHDISKGRYPKTIAVPLFIASACIPFIPSTYLFYLYLYLYPIQLYSGTFLWMLYYFVQTGLVLYGLFWVTVSTSVLLTKILDMAVTKKYGKLKVGSYSNEQSDPGMMGWRVRGIYRKFCTWYIEMTRFKFLRVWLLRMYGLKIGKNVTLGRYILEDPFIEIGNNVFMGRNTIISGHLIDHHKLTINRTIIGNNVIMDNFTGCVGTSFGDNSIILGKYTCGIRGQTLKGDGIYKGTPLKKVGAYSDFTPEQIKNLKNMIKSHNKFDYREERVEAIERNKWWLRFFKTLVVIIGGIIIGTWPLWSYCSLMNSVLGFPTRNVPLDLIILIPVPFLLMSCILFFCLGIGFITWLILFTYRIVLNKGLEEGVYDLDDPRVKAWKTNYLLKLFIMKLIHHSPFVYTDVFILLAFRNKVSTNVRINKCFYDPEFIDIGANTECAAFSIIHTHQITPDGKLHIKRTRIGKNVIIGGFAHIGAGVEIGDNTIVGLATYIPDDMKLEPDSLYVGNPPKRYPKSILKKKYDDKKRKVD